VRTRQPPAIAAVNVAEAAWRKLGGEPG